MINRISVFIYVDVNSQLSCQTASPLLSDRTRFPKYYQFLPSMRDIAPAYVEVIKEFGWRHVVVIVQNENLFTQVICVLLESLINYNCDCFVSCCIEGRETEGTSRCRKCFLHCRSFQ